MAPHPDELLRETEDLIEEWLCELDDRWQATLEEAEAIRAAARDEAAQIVALARLEAEEALGAARREAAETVVAADEHAGRIIAEAHATAGEHTDVIRALDVAEREAAGEELVALRQAVDHLRAELSRLVDAAFDALPAVEATSEAIDRALGQPEPDAQFWESPAPPRRGLLRRLLRR